MAIHTPNGPEGYYTTFKDLGGLIDVHDAIAVGASGVKLKVVNFVENADYDYDTVSVMPTLLTNVVTAVTAQTTGATNVRASITSYFTNVLKDDLSSTATTASGVLTDLKTQMAADAPGDGLVLYESGIINRYLRLYANVNFATAPSGTYNELTLSEALDIKENGTAPGAARVIPDSLGKFVVY